MLLIVFRAGIFIGKSPLPGVDAVAEFQRWMRMRPDICDAPFATRGITDGTYKSCESERTIRRALKSCCKRPGIGMRTIADRRTWWLGVAGLLGALLLAVGDQCLYFAPVSGAAFNSNILAVAASAPIRRALFGAELAPIAALLYLAGFAHVCAHVRERQPLLAALIWVGLALCILAGSIYHALWGAKILVLHASALPVAGVTALYAQLHDYAAVVYWISEITGYPAILLLAIVIILRRSDYPRWFCLFLPAVPFLILQWLTPFVPAPLGSLIGGSAANLSFALFFAVSLVLTRPRSRCDRPRVR